MNALITTLIVGISLSMDAFSLSLVYGTTKINKKDKLLLSSIVGIYHFIMPLIGLYFGYLIIKYIPINLNYIVLLIFLIIGLELIISSIKEKQGVFLTNIINYILFGLSVSIDSFTVGLALNVINNNHLQVSIIFCLISGLFTYIGLNIGNKLNIKYGKISTIIGGLILILLSISYLV